MPKYLSFSCISISICVHHPPLPSPHSLPLQVVFPGRWPPSTSTCWLRMTWWAAAWTWAPPASPSASTASPSRACSRTSTWTAYSSPWSASQPESSKSARSTQPFECRKARIQLCVCNRAKQSKARFIYAAFHAEKQFLGKKSLTEFFLEKIETSWKKDLN